MPRPRVCESPIDEGDAMPRPYNNKLAQCLRINPHLIAAAVIRSERSGYPMRCVEPVPADVIRAHAHAARPGNVRRTVTIPVVAVRTCAGCITMYAAVVVPAGLSIRRR